MSFYDNFVFRSKPEREKEMKEYSQLIFPFGTPHRNAVQILMRQIAGETRSDKELLGIFVTAKEYYLSMEESSAEKLLQWMNRTVFLMPEQRALTAAFVVLDAKLEDFLHFPTYHDVCAYSRNWSA